MTDSNFQIGLKLLSLVAFSHGTSHRTVWEMAVYCQPKASFYAVTLGILYMFHVNGIDVLQMGTLRTRKVKIRELGLKRLFKCQNCALAAGGKATGEAGISLVLDVPRSISSTGTNSLFLLHLSSPSGKLE